MGRPTKCTPAVTARIIKAIRLGMTYEHAAQYGGISYQTFRQWILKGENGGAKVYREFAEALKSAEAENVVECLATLKKAARDGTWQAAAWQLERRYPHIYGRQAIDLRVTEADPIEDMSDDELDARILELADEVRKEHEAKQRRKRARSGVGVDG